MPNGTYGGVRGRLNPPYSIDIILFVFFGNRMEQKMKSKVKFITTAAVLLAICIISQLFKNLSVFITGPIINACLIIAVLTCGYFWGVVLSVLTPITAFLITGAPVMKAVPALIPLIMAGNVVLVTLVWLFVRKRKAFMNVVLGGVIGSLLKAGFMTLTISYGVLTIVPLPEKLQAMLPVLQTTYSLTPLITALIGTAYACVIWLALRKVYERD
jgi:hypothetical protein